MISEIPTFEFELDSHPLPLARIHLALRLAIGVPGLYGFNVIPHFASDHSEEEDDALLVDRLMPEPTEVNRIPVRRAAIKFGMSVTLGERRRGSTLRGDERRECCSVRPRILNGKKCHDVGPLRLAVCEFAELRRNRRPGAKPFFKYTGAVGSVSSVLVASGDLSHATNELPPVFEKNFRTNRNVGGVRLQSSRSDGFPPARKVLEDLVLRHAR